MVRSEIEANPGAERLGEVALVDGSSAVGRTGITFWNVLFDENASCHLAYGAGVVPAVERADELDPEERHERGINHAATHRDFMIGSPEVAVSGVSPDGDEVAILVDEEWVLE